MSTQLHVLYYNALAGPAELGKEVFIRGHTRSCVYRRHVRASHTAQPRSAFGGTVTYPIAMPPLITATAKVHSADENQVGANNGGGIYRWPEFDSRAGVSRLQPYPRLAHASYSLRKATKPKNPVPLEPNA